MLSLAIKAKMPVISVRTSDLLNFPDVLRVLSQKAPVHVNGGMFPAKGDVVYTTEEYPVTRNTYMSLAESGRSMVLVNQPASPFAFDAGEVPVPKELMRDLLDEVVGEEELDEFMACFSGLTLKTTGEIIRLVEARDKSLTVKGVMAVRAKLAGKTQGLGQVDTVMPLYLCPSTLRQWIDKNKPYFLEARSERLVPRGVLMDGPPGVGKSAGAKYIATEFGVPLYRLDLGSSLGMWVGESEKNFARVFDALDQEEPCVLLIDEAEKVFAKTEDQGVTARLISQILWWLAEHKSRVLTVMTTNNLGELPPELYREGRIDTVLKLESLTRGEACNFAVHSVLAQFITPKKKHADLIRAAITNAAKSGDGIFVPHAKAIQIVYDLIKEHRWV